MINKCLSCQSDEVKISRTYSNMWFCKACGYGDYLQTLKNLFVIDFNTSIESLVSNSHHKKNVIIADLLTCQHYKEQMESRGRKVPLIGINSLNVSSDGYKEIVSQENGLYCMNISSLSMISKEKMHSFNFDNIIVAQITSSVYMNKTLESFIDLIKKMDHDQGLKKKTNLYIYKPD